MMHARDLVRALLMAAGLLGCGEVTGGAIGRDGGASSGGARGDAKEAVVHDSAVDGPKEASSVGCMTLLEGIGTDAAAVPAPLALSTDQVFTVSQGAVVSV